MYRYPTLSGERIGGSNSVAQHTQRIIGSFIMIIFAAITGVYSITRLPLVPVRSIHSSFCYFPIQIFLLIVDVYEVGKYTSEYILCLRIYDLHLAQFDIVLVPTFIYPLYFSS